MEGHDNIFQSYYIDTEFKNGMILINDLVTYCEHLKRDKIVFRMIYTNNPYCSCYSQLVEKTLEDNMGVPVIKTCLN